MSRRRREGERASSRTPLPRGYGVIWSTVMIDLIGFGIAIPVLGPLARDRFGASGLQVGVLGAMFSLAQFVMAPVLGRLSDRIGRKPVLLLSLTGTAIASLLVGVAGTLPLLFVARFLDGASGASVAVAQAAVADLATPEQRPRLLGMLGAAFGIGFTVGPAIGALAAWAGGARAPFFIAAAMAALNAATGVVRLPETRREGAPDAAAPRRSDDDADVDGAGSGLARRWSDNGLPLLIAVSFTTMFAFSAFEQTFTIFGQERIGFTAASASGAFVIVGITISIVQGGLIGRAVRALGELPLLRVGTALTAIGLGLLAATSGWGLLVPSLVLLSVGQGFAGPTMTSVVSNRVDPARRGALLGTVQSASSLGRVLGPVAGGLAFDRIGIASPFVGGASLFALVAVALGVARRAASQAPSAPAGSH